MDWSDLKSVRGQVVAERFRLEAPIDPVTCAALRLHDRSDAWFHRLELAQTSVDLQAPLPVVRHPGVASIWHQGVLDERFGYLITQAPEGPSLDDMLEEGPLPVARVLDLLVRIAEAMKALHKAGLVLGNLRTADVRLGSRWETDDRVSIPPHPVLLGPAVGRALGGYCATELSAVISAMPDGRADQFSLGVIGFELLTGTTPHNPDAPPGERTQLPILPNPNVPAAVEPLLERLLGALPGQRYADDDALMEALLAARSKVQPAAAIGQFTPVIMPVRGNLPLPRPMEMASLPPLPTPGWDDMLARFVLLLIIFVTVLAASTVLVLTFW